MGPQNRFLQAKQEPDAESQALLKLIDSMKVGDRHASAQFIEQYGPLIRRRVRGKLSSHLRRICDSMDLLSTIQRRLDLYVSNKKLLATDIPQLWQLINRISDAAVIDKLRALERLRRAEKDEAELADLVMRKAEISGVSPEDELADAIENAIAGLSSRDDRDIVILWSHDVPLARIAEQIGRSPGAVRQRWMEIRKLLRVSLEKQYY